MRYGVMFLVVVALSACLACGADLSGQWEGDGLLLTVRTEGDAVSGTIERDQRVFDFTAARSERGFRGQFKAGDDTFDCVAELIDDTLNFRSGSSTYALRRKTGAANPLDTAPADTTSGAAKVVRHPRGFACTVPEGWRSVSEDEYVELYGPTNPKTQQPSAYVRVAAVEDPAFTRIDDAAYLNSAIASMKENEEGLALDGDARTFTNGRTQLVMIPFKLKVEGFDQPLPARAVMGVIKDRKLAVIFMVCEPAGVKECEQLAIGCANEVINGVDAPPARRDQEQPASPITGKWSDGKTLWTISDATLTREADVSRFSGDERIVFNTRKERLFCSTSGDKLYVASDFRDAWDKTDKCTVYTFGVSGETLTLTDASGTRTELRRVAAGR